MAHYELKTEKLKKELGEAKKVTVLNRLAQDILKISAELDLLIEIVGNLKIDDAARSDFSAIFQLAEATSHIPILEAWSRLSKIEKKQFEKTRVGIEDQYKEFVVDAARRLKGKSFN